MKGLTSRALAAAIVATIALSTTTVAGATGGDKQPLHLFATGEEVVGTYSTLIRSDDGITSRIRTADVAGDAYTAWYVIFNAPSQCSDAACGPDDLFVNGDMNQGFDAARIAAARVSVLWANAGDIANAAGRLVLDGGLAEGEVPGGANEVVIGLDSDGAIAPQAFTGAVVTGLEDARAAEVHIVVQRHGAAHEDPALLAAQLSQFQGACNPSCSDVQFAVHLP